MKTTQRTRKDIRKRLDDRSGNSPIAFEDEIADLLDDADRLALAEKVIEAARDFCDRLTVAPGDKHSDVERYNLLATRIAELDAPATKEPTK